ncbi:MAG: DUF1207 domain-containing protein [Bacteroidota bacterium]
MKKFALLSIFFSSLLFSQGEGFAFYNGPLNFRPLVANTFEPRVGLIWHSNNNRLRLDIGNSIDLIRYQYENKRRLLTIGSDFFTYTLLRGEKNFHFPVDAVDYLFGFNTSYRDTFELGVFTTRLRLSHISAHFVDGHYDGPTGVWKDGLSPRVYSREFFDLTVGYEPDDMLRFYIGSVYLWHVDPTSIPKSLLYVGSEIHYSVTKAINLYAAYQFTVTGMRPRHELQTGIKIGNWNGRGTQLYFIYHNGNSIHGEYYDQKDEYSGIGFNIDL